ncbi:MAG: lipoprotein-releasing system ATP-binding protein [Acidobacteriota bacterium]|jgi:lipoprotein-releasing system ATP-binding protein|nr:lipoprotein-releasing system ATP-binding protein [Acidobacteriota bacterium]
MAFLEARSLSKTYRNAEVPVIVFGGLDLVVQQGEMLAIVGPSGIGKSTLLHLLGGLDRPDSGTVRVAEQSLDSMTNDALARFRNKNVGFVFQFHHLLPEFTAVENVAMPGWIGRMKKEQALQRAAELLAELGLEARSRHFPNQLSGGEQQRVAIARALLADPLLFLADEPTGNLDLQTSEKVFDLMRECHNKRGLTSVIVTHNPDLAARCDRVFEMKQQRHN